MAAAMAATAVEPAATAAMEAIASVEAAAVATTMPAAVTITTTTVIAAATIVAMPVVAASIIAATVETAAVVAVIPRTSADEDSAGEVVRSVVAVGRAGVRIVAVVTVGADRRWANGAVNGAYADANANLGVGAARCGKKQNS